MTTLVLYSQIKLLLKKLNTVCVSVNKSIIFIVREEKLYNLPLQKYIQYTLLRIAPGMLNTFGICILLFEYHLKENTIKINTYVNT